MTAGNFYLYKKSTGEIVRTISAEFSDLIDNIAPDEGYGEGIVSFGNQYVDTSTGLVVAIPPPPGDSYVFDYATKAWVFDTAAATAAAMSQIDTLLAEGPDRISPLWWAAMTPATQALWAQYRTDILSVPNQPGFPKTIVWPAKPSVGT